MQTSTTTEPVTITTVNADGTTQTAPRPESEPINDTARRARTLAHGFDIRAVRVHRGEELVTEYQAITINPTECGIYPALWHLVNIQTEHAHDAHAHDARAAIERGDEARAAEEVRAMEEAAQRYAAQPMSKPETMEAMDSVAFGIGALYSATFA